MLGYSSSILDHYHTVTVLGDKVTTKRNKWFHIDQSFFKLPLFFLKKITKIWNSFSSRRISQAKAWSLAAKSNHSLLIFVNKGRKLLKEKKKSSKPSLEPSSVPCALHIHSAAAWPKPSLSTLDSRANEAVPSGSADSGPLSIFWRWCPLTT